MDVKDFRAYTSALTVISPDHWTRLVRLAILVVVDELESAGLEVADVQLSKQVWEKGLAIADLTLHHPHYRSSGVEVRYYHPPWQPDAAVELRLKTPPISPAQAVEILRIASRRE